MILKHGKKIHIPHPHACVVHIYIYISISAGCCIRVKLAGIQVELYYLVTHVASSNSRAMPMVAHLFLINKINCVPLRIHPQLACWYKRAAHVNPLGLPEDISMVIFTRTRGISRCTFFAYVVRTESTWRRTWKASTYLTVAGWWYLGVPSQLHWCSTYIYRYIQI